LKVKVADLDSDLQDGAGVGNFYVQPTPPEGGPNTGWVNSTNYKLYAWDTDVEVWVQVLTQ